MLHHWLQLSLFLILILIGGASLKNDFRDMCIPIPSDGDGVYELASKKQLSLEVDVQGSPGHFQEKAIRIVTKPIISDDRNIILSPCEVSHL